MSFKMSTGTTYPTVSYSFKQQHDLHVNEFCETYINNYRNYKKFENDMLHPVDVNVNVSTSIITLTYETPRRDISEDVVFDLLQKHTTGNWKMIEQPFNMIVDQR